MNVDKEFRLIEWNCNIFDLDAIAGQFDSNFRKFVLSIFASLSNDELKESIIQFIAVDRTRFNSVYKA